MLAELVCSNSLGSSHLPTASAALIQEMRLLGSLLVAVADRCAVPAGRALAVDRARFAADATRAVTGHARVRLLRREVTSVPDAGVTVVATGPLTSPQFQDWLADFLGERNLHFYDALSPIVSAESLNRDMLFRATRYGAGEGWYLNAPLTEDRYRMFVRELVSADVTPPHSFERRELFRACQPIEELARSGVETLAHGPMRPMGLTDPRTSARPYAVVQLRPENAEASCFGLVGFQTRLTRSEQRRVFRLIPGMERSEFLRYGAVHRNTFIDGPRVLRKGLLVKDAVLIAGQLTGAEGYLESAATGILAGMNAVRLTRGEPLLEPPPTTVLGALVGYVRTGSREGEGFQPMNAHFGLLPPLADPPRPKRQRRQALCDRAQASMRDWIRETVG